MSQDLPVHPALSVATLPLSLCRTRLTLRLLDDTVLPASKGALLRGGFGYAFQRASCPRPCWNASKACPSAAPCPFRQVFEPTHPPHVGRLHDLHDIPRPFVTEPPLDQKIHYVAGEALEFDMVVCGRGIDMLPYFLFAFEQLGSDPTLGLGRLHTPFRLERVEALQPWQPIGITVYADGRARADGAALPIIDGAAIAACAAALPADLRLELPTPLRVKARGDYLHTLDLTALVTALCWRLNALAVFHGGGPWNVDYRALAIEAAHITVEQSHIQWVDWERTSTRSSAPRTMNLGGIVGSAVLRDVPPMLRSLFLAGSLVHAGKACVFGHGKIDVHSL